MKDRIKRFFKKLFDILRKPEMAILPANIAFYLILSIIPILTVVVYIASKFDISIDLVADLIRNFMPAQVSESIIEVISGKGFDTSVGFFILLAFILASNGTYAIINTSDALYQIKNGDVIKKRISSILILILILLLFLFLLIVPVFGDKILDLIASAKILENVVDDFRIIFNAIKWPISIFIIYFNIKLIYTVSPSINIKSKETTYGAIFTTVMWIVATIVFRFYLTYFARYDILYGNLSTMIIMMVWVYFLSYIFVFGMAINVTRRDNLNKEKEEIKE